MNRVPLTSASGLKTHSTPRAAIRRPDCMSTLASSFSAELPSGAGLPASAGAGAGAAAATAPSTQISASVETVRIG